MVFKSQILAWDIYTRGRKTKQLVNLGYTYIYIYIYIHIYTITANPNVFGLIFSGYTPGAKPLRFATRTAVINFPEFFLQHHEFLICRKDIS